MEVELLRELRAKGYGYKRIAGEYTLSDQRVHQPHHSARAAGWWLALSLGHWTTMAGISRFNDGGNDLKRLSLIIQIAFLS